MSIKRALPLADPAAWIRRAKAGEQDRGPTRNRITLVSDAEAEQLDVAVGDFGLAGGCGLALHGDQRLAVLLAFTLARLRLVIAGDHHGPIGPLAAGVLRA